MEQSHRQNDIEGMYRQHQITQQPTSCPAGDVSRVQHSIPAEPSQYSSSTWYLSRQWHHPAHRPPPRTLWCCCLLVQGPQSPGYDDKSCESCPRARTVALTPLFQLQGAANGLAFIHSQDPPMVHGNVHPVGQSHRSTASTHYICRTISSLITAARHSFATLALVAFGIPPMARFLKF